MLSQLGFTGLHGQIDVLRMVTTSELVNGVAAVVRTDHSRSERSN